MDHLLYSRQSVKHFTDAAPSTILRSSYPYYLHLPKTNLKHREAKSWINPISEPMVLILFCFIFLTINILLYKNDNEDRCLVAVGFKICFIDFYRRHISLASNQICGSPSFRSAWPKQLSWWYTLMCWWATCCKLQLSYWFNSCYICNLPLLKCKIGFLVLKWYNMPNSLIPYFLAQVR